MKVYSIGREAGCDIVINDSTDVISRRHAVLNVAPSGKMTIVDQSHNGTYVNGIRISQNVPVPVTRKDNISFAHVARLDWNLVPNSHATIMRYVLMGFIGVLLIAGVIVGYTTWTGNKTGGDGKTFVVLNQDSIKQTEDRLRKEEKHRQDSIQKHVRDSLEKVYREKRPNPKPVKPDTVKLTPKTQKPDSIYRNRG